MLMLRQTFLFFSSFVLDFSSLFLLPAFRKANPLAKSALAYASLHQVRFTLISVHPTLHLFLLLRTKKKKMTSKLNRD